MALVGGYVDVTGFFVLYHLFTSHMSGNTAAFAAGLASHDWHLAWFRLLPIPTFFFASLFGHWMLHWAERRHWRRRLTPMLALECMALIAFTVAGTSYMGPQGLDPASPVVFAGLVSLLPFAMALQNSTLNTAGPPRVNTSFVTGNLVQFTEHCVRYGFWLADHASEAPHRGLIGLLRHSWSGACEHLYDMLMYGGSYFLFCVGGIAGGVVELHWGLNALWLPLGMLAAIMALDLGMPLL
jgi:uncharacterized membrane protein YoaK (UPF0700 family)